MKIQKKYKIWLIGLAIPILTYFVWGYFGFAGAWIPGKYDSQQGKYNIFWGLLGSEFELNCYRGTCKVRAYTPLKKYGLIDTTGNVIIPFLYKNAHNPFHLNPNLIFAENFKGKYGILNRKNETLVPFEYDALKRETKEHITKANYSFYTTGEFALSKDGKLALFEKSGKTLLPPEYSRIFFLFDDFNPPTQRHEYVRRPFFIADKGNHCYFVLENGEKIRYDFISTEVHFFNNKKKIVYIEAVQSKHLDKDFWKIDSISKNLYIVPYHDTRININNMKNLPVHKGLYDSLGNTILPLEYEKIEMGRNTDFAVATKNSKAGVYDLEKRKWIVSQKYVDIHGINSHLPMYKAWIDKATDKIDYYDYNGNLILSSKVSIQNINYQNGVILFYINGNRYRMYYNRDKQKFIWYKYEKRI